MRGLIGCERSAIVRDAFRAVGHDFAEYESIEKSFAAKNPAAMVLGRLGGSANTKAQNKARARNAKKGGWPKGRKRGPRRAPPSQ